MFNLGRDSFGIITGRIISLPRDVSHETTSPKDLVTHSLQVGSLIVINRNENSTSRRKQPLQQPQAWVHHAQPLVMAGEVFAFFADDFTKPFLNSRVVDSVVVHPTFVTRVIGRINVNTVDSSFIARQERFKSFEIVTMNDHVLGAVVRIVLAVLVI